MKTLTKQIKEIYLNDNRVISIGFSGGKDSTVILDLVFKALLEIDEKDRTKKVYLLHSDTKLEFDPLMNLIDKTFVNIESFIKKYNLPVVIKRVQPETKNSFFSLLLGKGYTLPTRNSRWCTGRLKVDVMDNAIKEIVSESGGFIAITGQRRDEGSDRAKRLMDASIEGSVLKSHDRKDCSLYAPIELWSDDDVWKYIFTEASEWVLKAGLGKIYADASVNDGDECRTLLEGISGEQSGCSQSSRYGCWICSLRSEDKTLNKLGEKEAYIKKMESFRNELIESVSYNMGSWSNRDTYMHGKFKEKIYDKGKEHRKGMRIAGGYKLDYRKEMFGKLMELEREIYSERGSYLVDDAEVAYIQELWVEEGDYELSALRMAHHRDIEISNKHLDIVEALIIYRGSYFRESDLSEIEWSESHWSAYDIHPNANERYFAQLSLEAIKRGRSAIYMAHALTKNVPKDILAEVDKSIDEISFEAMEFIADFKVNCKQSYPSDMEEEFIRDEWKKDFISFATFLNRLNSGEIPQAQKLLVGYSGEFSHLFEQLDELEEVGDVTLCESISLNDKMRMIEEW